MKQWEQNLPHFAFLLSLRRVDIPDFSQSWMAKFQQHLLLKKMNRSFFPLSLSKETSTWNFEQDSILKTSATLWTTARVSNDNCCKPQNVPGGNQVQPRWWHFSCLSTKNISSLLRNQKFIFFPKMSISPLFTSVPTSHSVKSFLLCWHPVLLTFYWHIHNWIKLWVLNNMAVDSPELL